MRYRVHEFRFKKYLDKEEIQKTLELFLNALEGEVTSIIPITSKYPGEGRGGVIELLLIIEEIEDE